MSFLNDLVIVFCLCIAVLLTCYKFKIPSIVGFLITGVLCGPTAFKLISDAHTVEILAEIGIVLLLFTIGMEMSKEELKRLKRPISISGTSQVFLTLSTTLIFAFLFTQEFANSIFIGCLVALSSTAIVLSLLQSNAQTDSPHGRVTLAILIFQDIAIVPMVLAIPLLAGTFEAEPSAMLIQFVIDFLIIAGILLFGKFILPKLMFLVMKTKSRDFLLFATLGITFAIALLTSYAGLSLSLGAFLAGVLLAESEYSLSVLENVLPFKDVFTSVFFISVGMLLDIPFFIANLPTVIMIAIALIVVKIAAAYPSVRFLGYSPKTAIIVSFSLAQIGEFSFVLAKSGMSNNLIGQNDYQLFLAASVLTMSFTPVLMHIAPKVADIVVRIFFSGKNLQNAEEGESHDTHLKNHLIIIGFGVGGKNLARISKEMGIHYHILEANPETVAKFRDIEPIHHGDASLPLILMHSGIKDARALAILTPDPAATRAIVSNARKLNPQLFIVARTRFLGETSQLLALGADKVIAEEFEASIGVFAHILDHYLVPQQETQNMIYRIRKENYTSVDAFSEGQFFNEMSQISEDLSSSCYEAEEGSPIVNKSLAELALPSIYGISVLAISRNNEVLKNLNALTLIKEHDKVYLFGESEKLIKVQTLFTHPDNIEEESESV